jgi:hypothetical protein
MPGKGYEPAMSRKRQKTPFDHQRTNSEDGRVEVDGQQMRCGNLVSLAAER